MQLEKPELDVGIVPSSPEDTLAYYRDVLGFKELPSAPIGRGAVQHRLRFGRHLIKLNQQPKPVERERGGTERAIGMRLLAFLMSEADLDEKIARLRAADKKVAVPDMPGSSGFRVAFTKDPEGNVLELVGLRAAEGDAPIRRLQIGLTVADVERSRKFYGETLGLREEPPMQLSGGNVSVRYGFQWGTTTIKFWQMPGELPVHTGAPNSRAGVRYFTAMVDDLDKAHAELVQKGVPIAAPPTELPGVAKLMFISDPDGNWIELAQRL